MKRTLIVATTSYAGMGPYVSEIVNTFSPEDDVWYFFHDYEDEFFKKNVKKELHEKSVFYRYANSTKNKLFDLVTNRTPYDDIILKICRVRHIELVHYINGIPSKKMQHQFENLGITVLSTVHDLEAHEANKVWYKMLRQRIVYKRLAENLSEAKYLVTNSMEQYSVLKKSFPNKQLVFHSFPSLVSKEIVDGHDVPSELMELGKPYILFFGRIEAYKGISLLYQAFIQSEELRNKYQLVIAGSGDLYFDREDNDNADVTFINRYIKDSEVAYLYQHAQCVVYPYISATQSGVLSLAFYYQVPVLVSDVPFFKNIIVTSGAGLIFKKGNVDDLKNKLLSLLWQNNDKMKSNQKNYYNSNYDGMAINTSLKKIYSMEWTESDMGGAILTHKQLKKWIKADLISYKMKHSVAARFTYGENWDLFSYMRNLRYLEYYTNKVHRMPWDNILRAYFWLRHRKNCKKLNIFIAPNSVGPGFHLQHRGFRHIVSSTKIGKNCEMLPMVLIGKKRPNISDCHVRIGDNCYISTGVIILAPINIGNNVTIAAGAVVTKDVPDNSVVGGIPAKLLMKHI